MQERDDRHYYAERARQERERAICCENKHCCAYSPQASRRIRAQGRRAGRYVGGAMTERRMRGAMHREPWSPAQDEQLREMAKSERDRRVIAQKFGRTSEAVSSRMAKLGLTGD